MNSGDVLRHEHFYRDEASGQLKRKYLVLLAPTASENWVAGVLTSQANMRHEVPPCSHRPPYPGFFLGIPGEPLILKTWVDLGWLAEVDPFDVSRLTRAGVIARVLELPKAMLTSLLGCAAAADDTTVAQERAIRDQLSRMR